MAEGDPVNEIKESAKELERYGWRGFLNWISSKISKKSQIRKSGRDNPVRLRLRKAFDLLERKLAPDGGLAEMEIKWGKNLDDGEEVTGNSGTILPKMRAIYRKLGPYTDKKLTNEEWKQMDQGPNENIVDETKVINGTPITYKRYYPQFVEQVHKDGRIERIKALGPDKIEGIQTGLNRHVQDLEQHKTDIRFAADAERYSAIEDLVKLIRSFTDTYIGPIREWENEHFQNLQTWTTMVDKIEQRATEAQNQTPASMGIKIQRQHTYRLIKTRISSDRVRKIPGSNNTKNIKEFHWFGEWYKKNAGKSWLVKPQEIILFRKPKMHNGKVVYQHKKHKNLFRKKETKIVEEKYKVEVNGIEEERKRQKKVEEFYYVNSAGKKILKEGEKDFDLWDDGKFLFEEERIPYVSQGTKKMKEWDFKTIDKAGYIALGLDTRGKQLELTNKLEVFIDWCEEDDYAVNTQMIEEGRITKKQLKQEFGIEIIEPTKKRKIPNNLFDKCTEMLEPVEMVDYINVEWDTCRDDWRDGRYHPLCKTNFDYSLEAEKGNFHYPGTTDIPKQSTYEMEVPGYGKVKAVRRPTHLNPALDVSAIDPELPWRHWGRRYYYEWPSGVYQGSINPDKCVSSRGLSAYMIEYITRQVLNYKEAEQILEGVSWDYRRHKMTNEFKTFPFANKGD